MRALTRDVVFGMETVLVCPALEPPERMLPGARVLRVFFDHGHEWPLWESGTYKLAMEPVDYGFSPALTELLQRWYEAWHPITDFDIDQPVPAPTDEDRHRETDLARQAVAMIRLEVPTDVAVDVSHLR